MTQPSDQTAVMTAFIFLHTTLAAQFKLVRKL